MSVATAAAATKSSGSSTFIILIIVFIGLIYFMAIRPGRNRQKKVAQQQNTVRPGARVRTTAGMYATVVAVDGDDVVLEVAPDIEVRYMKRAIMEVLTPGDEPRDEPEAPRRSTRTTRPRSTRTTCTASTAPEAGPGTTRSRPPTPSTRPSRT